MAKTPSTIVNGVPVISTVDYYFKKMVHTGFNPKFYSPPLFGILSEPYLTHSRK